MVMRRYINDTVDSADAVLSLAPHSGFSIGTDGSVNQYLNPAGITQPTTSEISAEVIRLQSAYDAQSYARNRENDYPSQGDQMDMIYKDNLNSTTTHKDAVEAIKTKWPKNNTGPVE